MPARRLLAHLLFAFVFSASAIWAQEPSTADALAFPEAFVGDFDTPLVLGEPVAPEGVTGRWNLQEQALRNLEAQESMAQSARWMFLVALASILLSTVGVGLVWGTLRYTRRASEQTAVMLNEAKETTRQAIGANLEARRANELTTVEQRPWLQLDFAVCVLQARTDRIDLRLSEVSVKNYGRTPARNVRVKAFLLRQDQQYPPRMMELVDSVLHGREPTSTWNSFSVLMPEEEAVQVSVDMIRGQTDEDMREVLDGSEVRIAIIATYLGSAGMHDKLDHEQFLSGVSYVPQAGPGVNFRLGGTFTTDSDQLVLTEDLSGRQVY